MPFRWQGGELRTAQVSEFTIDYTDCEDQAAAFTAMPSNRYSYAMSGGNGDVVAPQWSFTSDAANPNVARRATCRINFNVPKTMNAPVFMYYKLGNYYQNRAFTPPLHAQADKAAQTDATSARSTSIR